MTEGQITAAHETVVDGVVMLASLIGEFIPVLMALAAVFVGWAIISEVVRKVRGIGNNNL
jgi:hypothetical protein